MLHTLEKGEYPKGHRYWSNATGDLNAALEDLPVQLRRVLDELWSDGYGVECYLVEWNGRYCVQLSAMYDESYATDLGMGYPELVELARRRREMVERCEKNIEKAVNEGRLDAVLFVGGLDDAKREALEVMRGRGFEIGEEVWREGLFKYRDVYIARW